MKDHSYRLPEVILKVKKKCVENRDIYLEN